MKPKRLNKKLVLNKTTIAHLDHMEMRRLFVGADQFPITIRTITPDPCTTKNVPQCLTDPPTLCWTCPSGVDPCLCPQPVETDDCLH